MTTKTKNKLEKQIRGLELREFQANNDEMILEGYASVFDTPTVLWEYEGVEYKEIIDRHAFDNADFSDCCLKYNHVDTVPILARVRGGSLTTEIDDYGLKFSAKLFDTTSARDVYALVKQGGLDKCSFAFTVKREEYDSVTHTRKILEIDKVFDLSIVDIPAYEATSVSARSSFEVEIEKERILLENENKRKIAKALTYLV